MPAPRCPCLSATAQKSISGTAAARARAPSESSRARLAEGTCYGGRGKEEAIKGRLSGEHG